MNEKWFEDNFKASAREIGGHSFKVATPWVRGISDLYCKIPDHPSAWIELKFQKCAIATVLKSNKAITNKLTANQRSFLRDEVAAGGVGFAAHMFYFNQFPKKGEMQWAIAVISGQEESFIPHQTDLVFGRGKDIPVGTILQLGREAIS